MVKERGQNNNAKKLFALLTVIVTLSLVVNLLSLNALYKITETRQSTENGELSTLRSWWSSLWDPYYGYSSYQEYSDARFQEEWDSIHSPPEEEEEEELSARERYEREMEEWGDECTINYQCHEHGDDYCYANSVVYDHCEKGYCETFVDEECDDDKVCTEWWYLDSRNAPVVLDGVYECMDSAADMDYYSSSDSSCSGNADCPSTGCFNGRLMRMACISGKCDYGHRIGDC